MFLWGEITGETFSTCNVHLSAPTLSSRGALLGRLCKTPGGHGRRLRCNSLADAGRGAGLLTYCYSEVMSIRQQRSSTGVHEFILCGQAHTF